MLAAWSGVPVLPANLGVQLSLESGEPGVQVTHLRMGGCVHTGGVQAGGYPLPPRCSCGH